MDYSNFIKKMKKAIEHSWYRYGNAHKTYPELAQAYKCAKERLDLYLNSKNPRQYHNTELMVDVANFCMLEYMFPAFKNVHGSGSGSGNTWQRDWCESFVRLMQVNYPDGYEGADAPAYHYISRNLKLYEENASELDDRTYLISAAVAAATEHESPSFEDASHRDASDADSPGLAGGISYKEMMVQVAEEDDHKYGW